MTLTQSYLLVASLMLASVPASAHDIYGGVKGRNGQLCCGGDPITGDCSATTYRESGGSFEFLTREKHWVAIPQDRITFLPIPGDTPSEDSHRAHLCYRAANQVDNPAVLMSGDGQSIFLYCAFVPPGGA